MGPLKPPRKTTTQLGLGWTHQQTRERLLRRHEDGSPCWWCGQPMYRDPAANFDGASLEADHSRARKYHGVRRNLADQLLHRRCNRQRGAGDNDDQRPAVTGRGVLDGANPGEEVTGVAGDDLGGFQWA